MLVVTLSQIIVEIVFLVRYLQGGSEVWRLGCEVLSKCMTDSGPASPVSKAFNEVDSMMNLIYAEILVNAFAAIMIFLQMWSNMSVNPSTARTIHLVTLFVEALASLAEVVISILALHNLDSIIDSLIGVLNTLTVSATDNLDPNAVATMCLLPCCLQSTTSPRELTIMSFPITQELISSSCTIVPLELSETCSSPIESLSGCNECRTGTHNCDPHATCTDTAANFTCACNPGFSGPGTSCVNINECISGAHNCHPNAICTDTVGSFTCACKHGYIGSGTMCSAPAGQLEDECRDGTHNCDANADCTDLTVGFKCTCKAGYSGSGTSCRNIDECKLGLHNCHKNAICTDTDLI